MSLRNPLIHLKFQFLYGWIPSPHHSVIHLHWFTHVAVDPHSNVLLVSAHTRNNTIMQGWTEIPYCDRLYVICAGWKKPMLVTNPQEILPNSIFYIYIYRKGYSLFLSLEIAHWLVHAWLRPNREWIQGTIIISFLSECAFQVRSHIPCKSDLWNRHTLVSASY